MSSRKADDRLLYPAEYTIRVLLESGAGFLVAVPWLPFQNCLCSEKSSFNVSLHDAAENAVTAASNIWRMIFICLSDSGATSKLCKSSNISRNFSGILYGAPGKNGIFVC